METIYSAPAIVKVLSSLLVILLVNRFYHQLWAAVLAGTAVLALWLGHSIKAAGAIAWERISGTDTVFLSIIVFQILWLSSQMSQSGIMKDLVTHIKSRVSQRAGMAILPAIIGILPMPGGAIFSAPMVGEMDTENTVPPILKAKINYWFRHIWEYWWPLYPGIILLLDITKLSVSQVFTLQFPLTIVSILAGYFFLLRGIDSPERGKGPAVPGDPMGYVKLLFPVIIVVVVYSLLELLMPAVVKINKYVPMIAGILAAQAALQLIRPLKRREWKTIILSKQTVILIILVCLIRVYGAFIESTLPDGSTLMARLQDELHAWGIPVFFLIIAVPFISGLTTGIALGFVGASFPIIMGLMGPNPDAATVNSTVVLAYCSGYIGMILSPVHVCLVVSNEYFKSSLTASIISLSRPALLVMASGILLYFCHGML